ncbi:unnamed protein product [Effrenium voratum]|nr:unnamed protein product [Effrenium voratum]
MTCAVCDGTGSLLREICPLCDGSGTDLASEPAGRFWCELCQKDLQSEGCLNEHLKGRKHLSRLKGPSPRRQNEPISKEHFFQTLAEGGYQNVIVCTGAGVSTAAGVPDFRSAGGLFEQIRETFGGRFPAAVDSPEYVLSREFVQKHPEVWESEVCPWLRSWKRDALPTESHRLCAWLHRQGWLRRVYTQNVDGLHTHPSLELPRELVVECHGSIRGAVVLYGDPMPHRFYDAATDFADVDLVLVMGTSLQVAPFCALPNLAEKAATRVLVNQNLEDCRFNAWSNRREPMALDLGGGMARICTTRIGSRVVKLQPLWWDRRGGSRWHQLLVEGCCDEFVDDFFQFMQKSEVGK